ncbi:hypothetical protein EJ06DRAFT_579645 [Trichodelitschia bisporula]|uniref:Uncharacterized protein n=1 Tax=Trichodelitschia bisporula TaxID=703511 RepID=A0A6G1I669_9PEZI|nr:hypothetical protein EJ06DRAFT_579645 [Trichodelitschia bisporula]
MATIGSESPNWKRKLPLEEAIYGDEEERDPVNPEALAGGHDGGYDSRPCYRRHPPHEPATFSCPIISLAKTKEKECHECAIEDTCKTSVTEADDSHAKSAASPAPQLAGSLEANATKTGTTYVKPATNQAPKPSTTIKTNGTKISYAHPKSSFNRAPRPAPRKSPFTYTKTKAALPVRKPPTDLPPDIIRKPGKDDNDSPVTVVKSAPQTSNKPETTNATIIKQAASHSDKEANATAVAVDNAPKELTKAQKCSARVKRQVARLQAEGRLWRWREVERLWQQGSRCFGLQV